MVKINLFVFAAIVVSIFIVVFVMASHDVSFQDGEDSFNVVEDVGFIFNISLNNTGDGQDANITQVNITLPENFTLILGYNGTDSLGSFENFSRVLVWTNDTDYLINGSETRYFWFNASVSEPGSYTIEVVSFNSSGGSYKNLTVVVNDTTEPSVVEFVNNTNESGSVLSWSYIPFNISVTENGVIKKIIVKLYNSTHDEINSSNSSISPFSGEFIRLSNGLYFVNVSVNDSYDNMNFSETRNFTLNDTTAPNFTLSASEGEESITVTITITGEGNSGVQSCSDSGGYGGSASGSGNSWSFTDTGLECDGEEYNYNVTCTDFAGLNYSVTVTFETADCSDDDDDDDNSGGGSPGGGSPTANVNWTNTFAQDSKDFSEVLIYKKALKAKQRVRIKFGTESHYVGVKSISGTSSAVVSVESTPQEKTLSVGASEKFEVTEDGFYDLLVTLTSIGSTRANVKINYLHEAVPETEEEIAAESGEANVEGAENLEKVGGLVDGVVEGNPKLWFAGIIVALLAVAALVTFMVIYYKKNMTPEKIDEKENKKKERREKKENKRREKKEKKERHKKAKVEASFY